MTRHALCWDRHNNEMTVMPEDLMLSGNRAAYRDDLPGGFVPVHIGTLKECEEARELCRPTLAARLFYGVPV
jgi:hypothetical protein